ncbi:MAG: hypothetical protein PHD02_03520 [Bacilli bacterium]|nr:hypothetical protein [Bacilli bacterium]
MDICVRDKIGVVQRISKEVFKQLNMLCIILITSSPSTIRERLRKRSCLDWTEEYIADFQNKEIAYAKKLSKELNIKLFVFNDPQELDEIAKIINKEILPKILFENYLKEDEVISIDRGYFFISKDGREYFTITSIPYMYKKPLNAFEIQENSYPLNHVLTPLNNNRILANMKEEDTFNYYLEYSIKYLKEVKDFFDNN